MNNTEAAIKTLEGLASQALADGDKLSTAVLTLSGAIVRASARDALFQAQLYDLSGRLNEVMLIPGVADLVEKWDSERENAVNRGRVQVEDKSLDVGGAK